LGALRKPYLWHARIEPVTPPGQVYRSEPFAALAEAEAVRVFVCDYMGVTAMTKKCGSYPTYQVRAVPPARRR
jgi:adenylate cyclase